MNTLIKLGAALALWCMFVVVHTWLAPDKSSVDVGAYMMTAALAVINVTSIVSGFRNKRAYYIRLQEAEDAKQ